MNGIRITIFVLIIMHLLPIAITQLLILEYPFAERKNGRLVKWISAVSNVLLNGLVLYEIVMYSKIDFVEMISLTCSYQDISRLAASNIISLALSVLIGAGTYICVCRYYRDERSFCFAGKCMLFLLFAAVPIILGYYYGHSGTSGLAINEICRRTTVIDPENDSQDENAAVNEVSYICVTNNGILTYELDHMYLSDSTDESGVWRSLRKDAIKPGETYQRYMLSDDSLSIRKSGGSTVYLLDQFGNVADHVEVPALQQDESYKNMETGWEIVHLAEVEEEEEIIMVSAPSFSQESGFYDEAFELELSAAPGTTIYYTLDSSNPTVRSMEYSEPIQVYDRSEEENLYRSIRNVQTDYLDRSFDGETPVDKCFVVRAIAVDSDGNSSDITTKSYFVNQNKYKNRTVLSLVSDPEGLFGDEYGIYVTGKDYDEWYLKPVDENGMINTSDAPMPNYEQKGIAWERESNLEVFKNADLLLTQPVGIRVQGGATRGVPLKRFSIYARDEYSSSDYFDVNLINGYSQHALYTRVGQSGGLHQISQMIGQNRYVATSDFILVDVFLDGEFWYSIYLCEKFNEKNFSQKYDLSKDNIVMAKYAGRLESEDPDGLEAGKNPFSSLATFIERNDLSDDAKYLEYSEILDVQSYIDWSCINIFMQNTDYNERANNLFWHTVICENQQEGDTRWRLALYDMDIGWDNLKRIDDDIINYEANPFTVFGPWQPGPLIEWPIFSALRKNELFCRQYVLTFMDLINTNLSVDNTAAIMEELGIENKGFQEFFENRARYIVPYVAEEFELTGAQGTVTLSSNISGTPIILNTISPELQSSIDPSAEITPSNTFLWTGRYFTDYPVTVTANAPGFSHWEVTANGSVQRFTDETIEVPVSRGGVQIHAVFK